MHRARVGVLRDGAALDTRGHPFFDAAGLQRPRLRHLPPARRRHEPFRGARRASAGLSPVDAIRCSPPSMARTARNLPQQDPASHSLLLERGLIRVALPWPPRGADGKAIDPEFTLEVVRDPTGCNTHPEYGLRRAATQVSVYRRPRPVANTKYTTHENFGVLPFIGKNGLPATRDPDTGRPSAMNLMADARVPSLAAQAQDAAANHLQVARATDARAARRASSPSNRSLYVAQAASRTAGSLEEPDGPSGLGPRCPAARARPACWATTPRAGSSRWRTSGSRCRAAAMQRPMRAMRRANPSSAVMTCTCSARSGSATPCT